MTRDEIIRLIEDGVAMIRDELDERVQRLVASKPLPPFAPPPVWTAGRHSASTSVRHANGLFMARRDTEHEPPHEDWLPLVVGLAGFELSWNGERTVALRTRLSDGTGYEMIRTLAVPLFRGYWSSDADYEEGDRVARFGEWHALKASKGVEPGSAGSDEAWLRVNGKANTERRSFRLSDDGELSESGHVIGSFKPMMRELLDDLLTKLGK
jgi:hypothetical protein